MDSYSNYFQLVPVELVELIIPYLNTRDIESFMQIYTHTNLLQWPTIFKYHFGYYGTSLIPKEVIKQEDYFIIIDNPINYDDYLVILKINEVNNY